MHYLRNDPVESARQLNSDLDTIHQWAKRWLVRFNPAKSESLLISRKINRPPHPQLIMNSKPINEVASQKHLGIFLSNDGTRRAYIILLLKFGPGYISIWITVGQGPTALVEGADGGCLDIFTLIYPFLSSVSLSLGDGPI